MSDRMTQVPLSDWITPLHDGTATYTLLAVCPTSDAVLRGALQAAGYNQAPLLIAATRNQVDVDGGYTGWTPAALVKRIDSLCRELSEAPPVIPCVDHGGPWCKDAERQARVSWREAEEATRTSIRAALDAGYRYVHIDTTIDPHHSGPPPVSDMVARTAALLRWTETYRQSKGLPRITYEVGVEEVAPPTVKHPESRLDAFLTQLQEALPETIHPTFVVGDVGTSFGTGQFDANHAKRVVEQVRAHGALVKAHYSDFVDALDAYPRCGIGGANIGPGLSAVEYRALCELESLAEAVGATPTWHDALREALVRSERWRKWVDHDGPFDALDAETQDTLLETGSRYVWADSEVEAARKELYDQVDRYRNADAYVVWRLRSAVTQMLHVLNLVGRADMAQK